MNNSYQKVGEKHYIVIDDEGLKNVTCDEDINFTTESALNKEAKSFYDYYYETRKEKQSGARIARIDARPKAVIGSVSFYIFYRKENHHAHVSNKYRA